MTAQGNIFLWTSYYDSGRIQKMDVLMALFAGASALAPGMVDKDARHCVPTEGPVGGREGPHICFCETNPPIFGDFSDATYTAHDSCDKKPSKNSVGSFFKTNPISGGK